MTVRLLVDPAAGAPYRSVGAASDARPVPAWRLLRVDPMLRPYRG
ncbi:MAG: hypothetical protein ACRDSH_24400 [Pseudonocardiaceae bacterium]